MDALNRAALYLRISLDTTGEMLAVERQRDDCRRLCEERGWEIVGEFVDNSISASDARKLRPGYDALVKAYDARLFDTLVCWDLDRLTRQPRQLEDWIDRARSGGLVIATANGEADLSTDGGMLFARIKLAVARGEVDRKSARQRRALQQRADIGRPPLGVRLTGYSTTGDVIESEAGVIRRIFREFANGESIKGITARLEDDGIRTRHGSRWSPSTVTGILRNPRYAGLAVYRGETTGKAGTWKALVSEDEFALVQARLKDPRRKTNKVGTHRRHLGSGLYICGPCKSRLTSWSGQRYSCANGCLTRARPQIDRFVIAVVKERLRQPDVLSSLRRPAEESAGPLEAQADDLRLRLERFEEDYDNGLIDGRRYAVATEKVRVQLMEVDQRLAALRGHAHVADLLAHQDPGIAFDNLSLMGQRAILETLVTVTLHSAPRGSRTFKPETVEVAWNGDDAG